MVKLGAAIATSGALMALAGIVALAGPSIAWLHTGIWKALQIRELWGTSEPSIAGWVGLQKIVEPMLDCSAGAALFMSGSLCLWFGMKIVLNFDKTL